MVDPGQMRNRITIQRHNGQVDRYGDPLELDSSSWVPVATVWAAVDPVSGREFYEAQQSQSEVSYKVRCRYRSDIVPGMRIIFGNHTLEIVSVIDWSMRHEHLLLMCREVLP
ncbi:MAG: phage head closure protein [Eubacteriales bacterium]|nr:phage head closure protein [Eubacteriales bacterium]